MHDKPKITTFYLRSGFGKVNEKQIEGMASKPEYALIRPSADELAAISDEVIQYSCACKFRYIFVWSFLIRHRLNCNGIEVFKGNITKT